ncbi:MAG: hypothetical protein H0U27_08675 [Nitrosopumilus sp.]|nr:hypothetical protein [Nitrosopumilus sp.]
MMSKLITLLIANQIGAVGATQLADALQRNSALTDLNLYGKHDMIVLFSLFSASSSQLFHIGLCLAIPLLIALLASEIEDAGATQLADALQRNSALTALWLECKHDMICVLVHFI